jgi:chemotaxis protein MotB
VSDQNLQPIVIKRIKKSAAASHGGAWKIAYADFVTAMMAFFLLMWLLGSTANGDLSGIADHFQNPFRVLSFGGGSGSGDATNIIKGGGTDLSRVSGQVKNGDVTTREKTMNKRDAQKQFEEEEKKKLEKLKKEIEKMFSEQPKLSQFKNQILLDVTTEGLKIQIVDEKNRPMFDVNSAELKPYTKEILHEIGKSLNTVENRVSLAGHTDASGYAAGASGFSNWELSANRANASRREMIVGGMTHTKILRVVGLASSVLFDRNDPLNPVNRRISIVVLNKRTEDAILFDESPESEVSSSDVSAVLPQVQQMGTPGKPQ